MCDNRAISEIEYVILDGRKIPTNTLTYWGAINLCNGWSIGLNLSNVRNDGIYQILGSGYVLRFQEKWYHIHHDNDLHYWRDVDEN